MKTLWIGSDHAGLPLKEALKKLCPDLNWNDVGTHNSDSCDYPTIAHTLSKKLLAEPNSLGVLICGSGVGVSIAANRHAGIRAVLAHEPTLARLAREHNNANIVCFGSRWIAPEFAKEILYTFINTKASTDIRHLKRIQLIEE